MSSHATVPVNIGCTVRVMFALGVVLLLAAPSAGASTRVRLDTSTTPGTLIYEESPGTDEASDLVVSGGSGVTFQELSGVTIETPTVAGCSGGGATVTCSPPGGFEIHLEDLNDRFQAEPGFGVQVDGGPGADEITGTTHPDVIVGGDGNDVIDGSFSVDTIDGGAGDDRLIGPDYSDVGEILNGGAGNDTVDYSESYVVTGNGTTAIMDGVLQAGETANVGSDVENLIGTTYVDAIVGNALDNVLDGGPGSCSDTISGGPGNDSVSFATHGWSVTVSLDGIANDGNSNFSQYCAFGETEEIALDIESVRGSPYADVLQGGAGANTLDGAAGDDSLLADADADALVGGSGRDTADYSARDTPLELTLDGANNDGAAADGPPIARDLISDDVEVLVGGSGDDSLTGNAQDNVLDGGLGDDDLIGLGGTDTADYSSRSDAVFVDLGDASPIDGAADELDDVRDDVENVIGGAGDDLLVGGAGANLLDGRSGDDVLDGGPGADESQGGPGFDLADYSTHAGGVVADLDGASGDDGAPGEGDTLSADIEALAGGPGADTLTGNGLDNILDGGPGGDVLNGGAGFDAATYQDRTAGVQADADGAGDDGEPGEGDTIAADVEDLIGGAGNDTLSGNGLENFLIGGPGDDRLDGGAGEDGLFGDDGADELTTRDDSGDFADCGTGDDLARADDLDELVDCERRDDAPPPPAPPPPPPPPVAQAPLAPVARPDREAPKLRVTISAQRLARVRQKGLRMRVSCSEPCSITARLVVSAATARRLRLASRTLGRASLRSVRTSKTLVVRLGTQARRVLVRRRNVRAQLTITATDASRNSRTTTRAVRLG